MNANTKTKELIIDLLCNKMGLDYETREIELINLIPELHDMYHLEHEQSAHCYNIFDHTLHVVDDMPEGDIGKLAALFHDIGKPCTKIRGIDGVCHYPNHPLEGFLITIDVLRRLEFDEETVKTVSLMVLLHDNNLDKDYASYERWSKAIGRENVKFLLALQKADLYAHTEKYAKKHERQINVSHERIELFARCLENAEKFDE